MYPTFLASPLFYTLAATINVIASLGLGVFILLQNRKALLNKTFFLFSLAIAVWSAGYVLWQLTTDPAMALLYARIMMVGAIFSAPAYLHFVLTLTGSERRERRLVYAVYTASVAFALIDLLPTFSSLFVSHVGHVLFFAFWPHPGPLYALYLVFWGACLAYAAYKLIVCIVHTPKGVILRQQAIFVLWAMLVAFVSGSTTYLLWYGVPVPPVANILVSIYVLIIGYAVLKHHLFHVKIILTELLMFVLWMFLFFRIFFSSDLNDQLINLDFFVIGIILGALLIKSVIKEVEQRERLQRLARELTETNERQEGLIHFIGHEVKGFLTKAEGSFSALIEGDFGHLPVRARSFSVRALAETRAGVASVSEILKAANLKKGMVVFNKKAFDLKALVTEVVEQARSLAQRKGLTLTLATDNGPCAYTGDRAELGEHVLRNLIENAVTYTPSGSIKVSLEKRTEAYLIRVSDTGIGITDENRPRLFTEGGRGKDSLRINVHSTGYGLFIAEQVVKAHGGTIHVESDGANKGSTFIVELPTDSDTLSTNTLPG